MNKIIMIMHMFKCLFFYCSTVYIYKKKSLNNQKYHICFPNSSQRPFTKIAGKGPASLHIEALLGRLEILGIYLRGAAAKF